MGRERWRDGGVVEREGAWSGFGENTGGPISEPQVRLLGALLSHRKSCADSSTLLPYVQLYMDTFLVDFKGKEQETISQSTGQGQSRARQHDDDYNSTTFPR